MFQSQLNINKSSWDQRRSLSHTLMLPSLLSLRLSLCLKVKRRPSFMSRSSSSCGAEMDFTVSVRGCFLGWMAADVFLYAAADASVSLSASLALAGCHICQPLGATPSFQSPSIRAQLIDYLCYSPAVAYRKTATQNRRTFCPFRPTFGVWMCLNPASCNHKVYHNMQIFVCWYLYLCLHVCATI